MINEDYKKKIVFALKEARNNFGGTDAKFATSIGISPAQWSRINKGDIERVISEPKWITWARIYNVQMKSTIEWKVARTPAFEQITQQLEYCQINSVSAMFCDIADIGKTFTAKIYASTHKNAVYVDCSQVKSRQKLIRFIAKSFGVGYTGKYTEVYEDLVFYLGALPNPPLIILDEAGDLAYDAFLELKALWNATERACGWVMMGADGLKRKIDRSIDYKKVGYAELFSRYGGRYQRITPESNKEQEKFNRHQASLIIKANAPANIDVQKIIANTNGSLRRIYTEITKLTA